MRVGNCNHQTMVKSPFRKLQFISEGSQDNYCKILTSISTQEAHTELCRFEILLREEVSKIEVNKYDKKSGLCLRGQPGSLFV